MAWNEKVWQKLWEEKYGEQKEKIVGVLQTV